VIRVRCELLASNAITSNASGSLRLSLSLLSVASLPRVICVPAVHSLQFTSLPSVKEVGRVVNKSF